MTLHITPGKVNNTQGTSVGINGGGSIRIGGDFQNSGDVQIDIQANLDILGNIINTGTFSIKDYINEKQYRLFESAINDLNGDAKSYLESSYQDLRNGDILSASTRFKKFIIYIKEHPELITSSVQILLQLFNSAGTGL